MNTIWKIVIGLSIGIVVTLIGLLVFSKSSRDMFKRMLTVFSVFNKVATKKTVSAV